MKDVLVSWSSGKDSAWTLELLLRDPAVRVRALVTNFQQESNLVTMHSVPRALVEEQARRVRLPLWAMNVPWPCSNAAYEEGLRAVCERARHDGIETIAFGDLFLQDIRNYREQQLHGSGLHPIFPLWHAPTDRLANEMIDSGLRAKIVCVDTVKLPSESAGTDYDRKFLESLPATVDPCGENGEFHTFVYNAPAFHAPIDVSLGEIAERDGFAFAGITAPSTQCLS